MNDFHNQKRADILWRSFDYKSTWRFHFIHDWEKWNIVRIGSICIDSTIEFYPDERTKPFWTRYRECDIGIEKTSSIFQKWQQKKTLVNNVMRMLKYQSKTLELSFAWLFRQFPSSFLLFICKKVLSPILLWWGVDQKILTIISAE